MYIEITKIKQSEVIFLMVSKRVKRFAIVKGDSAQQFTDALNEKLLELVDEDVTIEFYEQFLGARISWTEKIGDKPECLADEFELIGAGFVCSQCPMFSRALKADGTVDQRAKCGRCAARDNARVPAGRGACDILYKMILAEEVQLCLAK